jgi:hypothetical protein
MPAKLRTGAFCMLAWMPASLHAEERTLGPQNLLDGLMQNNPVYQLRRRTPVLAPERERIRVSRFRRLARVPVSGKARACFGGGQARGRRRPADLPRGCPGCDRSIEGCLLRVAHGDQGNRVDAEAQRSARPLRGDRAKSIHSR